ncbi:MAG: hypothetical protein HY074_05670 [Deltaproteobacteria bacterium]|nr:hypothetical protein [Deltaproteobacteria bacterium]
MIIAKWVIVAFLGFTAVFASDLRAYETRSKHPSADQLAASGKLTASMSDHISAIIQNLGVDVDISNWVLNEKKGDVERTLNAIDSSAFYGAFPQLLEKCSIKVTKINLTTSTFPSSGDLMVDTFEPSLLSKLAALPAQCEAIAAGVQDATGSAAPHTVSVNTDDIFHGRLTPGMVNQWAGAIKSTKFIAALDDYSRECRTPVTDIRLGTYSSYSQSDKQQIFSVGDGPAEATRRLTAAASACAKVVPALTELNAKYAIQDQGVLFSIEGQDFFQKRFSAAQVLAWIRFFESDAARIGQLKASVLKNSKKYDFSELKRCMADSSKSEAACNKFVVSVNFATFNDIMHPGVFTTLLFMMLGDPIIMPLLMNLSAQIKGPPVYLDVTRAPNVPTSFK